MIKHTKTYVTYRILLIVMFVFAIGGFIAQAIYKNSPKNAIPINDVNYLISVKEQKADKKIAEIENLLSRNSLIKSEYFHPEIALFNFFVRRFHV